MGPYARPQGKHVCCADRNLQHPAQQSNSVTYLAVADCSHSLHIHFCWSLVCNDVLLRCEAAFAVLLHDQCWLAQAASARVQCRGGSLLWQWPGVSAAERTVHAIWLGEAAVAAITTAGKIYTLPKQTGAPVTQFMRRLTVCFPSIFHVMPEQL